MFETSRASAPGRASTWLSSLFVVGCQLVGTGTMEPQSEADTPAIDARADAGELAASEPRPDARVHERPARDAGSLVGRDAAPSARDAAPAGGDDTFAPDAGPGEDGGEPEPPSIVQTCATPSCSLECVDPACRLDCDGQYGCTTRCAPETQCETDCRGNALCNHTCEHGATCSHDCSGSLVGQCSSTCQSGSTCRVDCSQGSGCGLTCESGSTCELDCTGALTCAPVICKAGAKCALRCDGAALCTLECNGVTTTCPSGVLTCDSPCPEAAP